MDTIRLANKIRSVSWLRSSLWKGRKLYWRLNRKILFDKPMIDLTPVLMEAILHSRPFATGKMGSTELKTSRFYIRRERARQKPASKLPLYSDYILNWLYVACGVFPNTSETFDRFCAVYLKSAGQCDALASWDVAGEANAMRLYCPNISICPRLDLEPYRNAEPWTSALAGKNVLVISPFTETMRRQYEKRDQLWADPRTLPDFNLVTLKAPLSAGIVKPTHPDWFAAFEAMCMEMNRLNYDVALIGAGAFSLPLAVNAKLHGKVGVHLGGGLQLLFGIMGHRWEDDKEILPYVNANWTRPSGEEKPATAGMVENACYW